MELYSLEKILGDGTGYVRVDAYGILLDWKLSRATRVAGEPLRSKRVFPNVYSFRKTSIRDLEPWKEKILFLASNAYIGDTRLEFSKQLVLIGIEYTGNPYRIKTRIPSWRILSGPLRYRKRVYNVEFLLRIPVYSKRHVVLITDTGEGLRFAKTLVYDNKRRSKLKVLSVIDIQVQPLFESTVSLLSLLSGKH